MQITLVAPTEDAVTDYRQVNAQGYSRVSFSADVLAGVEEVDIYKAVGVGWEVASDDAGTAYKLTATIQHISLEGGAIYAVNKDATANPCGVYANVVP